MDLMNLDLRFEVTAPSHKCEGFLLKCSINSHQFTSRIVALIRAVCSLKLIFTFPSMRA